MPSTVIRGGTVVTHDLTYRADIRIENGRIALPDGAAYLLLVLPNEPTRSLDLLRRLRDLVREGMRMVGPRPQRVAGLSGYPKSDVELASLVQELWSELNGTSLKERSSGKGRVFWGESLQAILG